MRIMRLPRDTGSMTKANRVLLAAMSALLSQTSYGNPILADGIYYSAEPARAYASQIVVGPNGKLYMYAPVLEARSDARDRFAIGVAVADTPPGHGVQRRRSAEKLAFGILARRLAAGAGRRLLWRRDRSATANKLRDRYNVLPAHGARSVW